MGVRDSTLHAALQALVADAAEILQAAIRDGDELPFELTERQPRGPRATALYCYRPLTDAFIARHAGPLVALPSWVAALRALVACPEGARRYLRLRGEPLIAREPHARAQAALRCLLVRVFEERSDFDYDAGRFAVAYRELEDALFDGQGVVCVLAPLLGVALDCGTSELALGEGLSLVGGRMRPDAPVQAVYGSPAGESPTEEPNVLAVATITQGLSEQPPEKGAPHEPANPVAVARSRFEALLAALELFARGEYAIGGLGWERQDAGAWRPVALGDGGFRPRTLTLISAAREAELRAFFRLVARRTPPVGEVAWALCRYQMGRRRTAPLQALSDYLLALRALLEPEGPSSGRLAGRLAALCAEPQQRAALAQRAARAVSLERAVIAGLDTAGPEAIRLVGELAEHLRALLRDIICGHLPVDVRSLADELIEDTAMSAVA
jgi:hypothetical protein